MKKISKISFFFVSLLFIIGFKNVQATTIDIGVCYQSHVQNLGWMNEVVNSNYSGTTGKSLRTEAIKIKLINPNPSMKVKYQVYVQNLGWTTWAKDGEIAGTTGKSLRIEAVRIALEDASDYHVEYKAHVQNIGWMNWVKDGQIAGTIGKQLRLEALQIRIVKNTANNLGFETTTNPYINSQAYIRGVGWKNLGAYQNIVESFKIAINNPLKGMGIRYKAHIQNIGWTDWVYDGKQVGTPGSGLRIEALKVELTGYTGGYGILYKTLIQGYGWQNFTGNGNIAGTVGCSRGIYGLIVQVAKSETYGANFDPNASNINLKPISKILDVPIISQNLELPTGCEITSITMMLKYAGANVDKVQLAHEMPYHSWNPNLGYVGSPFLTSGWTIYPPALCNLVKKYTGSAIDLTGCSIEDLENQIWKNRPAVVWVKMHSFSVHAIVLTGYDTNNFYYNDPWTGEKNKALNKNVFLSTWQSQNKRAISY